jgi:hypothetical protein
VSLDLELVADGRLLLSKGRGSGSSGCVIVCEIWSTIEVRHISNGMLVEHALALDSVHHCIAPDCAVVSVMADLVTVLSWTQ